MHTNKQTARIAEIVSWIGAIIYLGVTIFLFCLNVSMQWIIIIMIGIPCLLLLILRIISGPSKYGGYFPFNPPPNPWDPNDPRND